jgi:SAM-dependent methyltransferase
MDALCLPLPAASIDVVAALNLLDCVADPRLLLTAMAGLLRAAGRLLLATPFDWSVRATPVENWIGGHSQRAAHAGGAEGVLRALLEQAAPGLRVVGSEQEFAWQTRLHARSSVQYLAYLLALASA